MRELTEHADCVMPIDNCSLIGIVDKIENALKIPSTSTVGSSFQTQLRKTNPSEVIAASAVTSGAHSAPFDSMNNIVANMLLNLTSSSRFDGSLNVDLNEITANLVPYPRLHYLLTSMSPLFVSERAHLPVRGLEQMFTDAFRPDNQLVQCTSRLYLACALLARGRVHLSDVRRNVDRLRGQLAGSFAPWNRDGWKTGMCAQAAHGQPYSLLALANNTGVRENFAALRDRFGMLYRRKAHLHHYTRVQGMSAEHFDDAVNAVNALVDEYAQLEKEQGPVGPRIQVLS